MMADTLLPSAVLMGCVVMVAGQSLHGDLASALTWAAFDVDHFTKPRDYIISDHNDVNLTSLATPDVHDSNVTSVVVHTRRRRHMTLHPDGLQAAMDLRFNFPLFKVHEGTSFLIQIAILNEMELPGVLDSSARALTNIEDFVDLLGVDGRACVSRAMCEVASVRAVRVHGLLGELVHVFVRHVMAAHETVWSSEEEGGRALRDEYMEGGRRGRNNEDCGAAFPSCPFSVFNLLDHVRRNFSY